MPYRNKEQKRIRHKEYKARKGKERAILKALAREAKERQIKEDKEKRKSDKIQLKETLKEKQKTEKEQKRLSKLQLKEQVRTDQPCWICGWHNARCDKHRITPGELNGKYHHNNILIVCPNCHRIAHENKTSFKQRIIDALASEYPIINYYCSISNALISNGYVDTLTF